MIVPEIEAYERYLRDPQSLSDADVAHLAKIDRDLSTRAAALRAGYERPAATDWEKRALTKREFLMWHDDHFVAQLSITINRLNQLEQRLREVEGSAQKSSGGGVAWAGIFDDARVYREGELVTAKGSLWLATQDRPPGRPSEGISGWKLICKGDRER